MKNILNNILQRNWFFALLCLLALILYYNLAYNMSHAELRLHVDRPTWFKIYWAKGNAEFSEKNMVRVRVTPDRQDYSFFVTNLHGQDRLRIDPVEYSGDSRIESLVISQTGLAPIVLNSPETFAELRPLEQIGAQAAAGNGLSVTTTGDDGNFMLPLKLQKAPINAWLEWTRVVVLLMFLGLLYWAVAPLAADLNYVPAALMAALVLVATMAWISAYNVHPDEFVHIAASNYYVGHSTPPRLDDPAIADSYSGYGTTRLSTNEIYYLLNGKMMRLAEIFHIDPTQSARLLNLMLFAAIALFACKSQASRYLAALFLISPQVWYIFSYCNSDALALFTAFLAAWLLIEPESVLHRFLRGQPGVAWLWRGLAVACVVALMMQIKKNYLVFAVATLSFLAIDIFKDYPRAMWGTLIKRLVLVGLIGLAPLAVKKYLDYQANDWNFPAMVKTMRQQKAELAFRPDTPAEHQSPLLYKKARGIPFSIIIGRGRWCEKTFMCSFGLYGYHTITSSNRYYNFVRWTAVALLAYFLGNILFRGGWYHRSHAGIAVFISLGLIGAAVYHAWVKDFQTEGRYLFPILPMLGIVYARCRFVVERRGLALGIAALFFLACCSFIAVALERIPKQFIH